MTSTIVVASDRSSSKFETYSINAFLMLLSTVLILLSLFGNKQGDTDELGLYNPIYMFAHFSNVTYPVYYQFGYMTVHPPLHYFIVGLFMKLGLNLYYAAAAPFVIFVLIITLLLVRGNFQPLIKIGLGLGFFSALLLLNSQYAGIYYSDSHTIQNNMFGLVRPDLHLTLAWFAGLVALESARLKNWNTFLLFLGSLLLTYASGLHYWGLVSVAGVGVYAIWTFRCLPWRQALSKIIVIIAGVGVVGIPYFALFVIPQYQNIVSFIAEVRGNSTFADAISSHFAVYDYFARNFIIGSDFWKTMPAIAIPLAPILLLHIPTFFVSTIVLIVPKSTRGFALAALPVPMFVFINQHKSGQYLLPELVLILCGISILGLALIHYLAKKLIPFAEKKHLISALALAFCVAVIPAVSLFQNLEVSLSPKVADMDIARAAARDIVGANALIGGTIGAWYISGAAQWLELESPVLWNTKLPATDMKAYFSKFDAIAVSINASDSTINELHTTFSSYYLDGTLKIKGFVHFVGQGLDYSPWLFTAHQTGPLVGYVIRGTQLYRFDEATDGKYLFATFVCPSSIYYSVRTIPFSASALLLPKATPSDPSLAVVGVVIPSEDYNATVANYLVGCLNHETIIGTLSLPVDANSFLDTMAKTDRPIQFFASYTDAIIGAGKFFIDGRVNGLPNDRLVVYCKNDYFDVWGIDNNSQGFKLASITFTDLKLTRSQGLRQDLAQSGVLVANINDKDEISVIWSGGTFNATGQGNFAKTFTCTQFNLAK